MKKYIVDLETNGLILGYHEITEVSILRCEDMVQRVWLLNIRHPKRSQEQAITKTGQNLYKISQRKKYIEDVIPEINAFIKEDGQEPDGRVMIAHNVSFDRTRMELIWENFKHSFPISYFADSKEMARKYIKNHLKLGRQSIALDRLLPLFDIPHETNFHSAEVDVRNTFRLYKFLEKRNIKLSEFTKLSPKLINDDMKKLKKKYDLTEKDAVDVLEELEDI